MKQPWDGRMHRFTVEQYHRMIQTGILTEADRVELLEGWIVLRMPPTPPHDGTTCRVDYALTPRLPDDWLLRVRCSVTLSDSEPEPDVVVARSHERSYLTAHPHAPDVAMIAEVADSSRLEDRVRRGPIYARARIPVYWIVNLPESHIEVYTDPKAGKAPAYRRRQDYGKQDAIPLVLGTTVVGTIPVKELLP
jgi:Uma2 family endonuclease